MCRGYLKWEMSRAAPVRSLRMWLVASQHGGSTEVKPDWRDWIEDPQLSADEARTERSAWGGMWVQADG